MRYNPKNKTGRHAGLPQRKSIRLKGYDYVQAGLYFITICCQDRAHLLGEIDNGEMILNDAGMMVEKWYYELENKFNDIKYHEMVVMPNHFHCIIENVGTVGANLRVRPDNKLDKSDLSNETNITGDINIMGDINNDNGQTRRYAPTDKQPILGDSLILGEHTGSPLHRVVQWFKTMTTNEYIRGVKQNNWQPFNGKLWQRNYYEHIVRNENDYNNIAEYIVNNPKNWDKDKLK